MPTKTAPKTKAPAKAKAPAKKKAATKKAPAGKESGNRCWAGYEPVPGKAPGAKGSCKKKGS